MNSLLSRAFELQHAAHTLMYLGTDGEPLYSDDFCRQNKDVLIKCDSLFTATSSDIEEEANLCLALLMGYTLLSMIMAIKLKRSSLCWIVPMMCWSTFRLLYLKSVC